MVRRIAVNSTAELVERTPVDTGWARANWVPRIGAPFEDTAGSQEQAQSGRVNLAPQSQGTAELLRYRLRRGPAFISNNVPYIGLLNQGRSPQAPAGFVQQAIAAGIRSVAGR